jgi:hypothetical protein
MANAAQAMPTAISQELDCVCTARRDSRDNIEAAPDNFDPDKSGH